MRARARSFGLTLRSLRRLKKVSFPEYLRSSLGVALGFARRQSLGRVLVIMVVLGDDAQHGGGGVPSGGGPYSGVSSREA